MTQSDPPLDLTALKATAESYKAASAYVPYPHSTIVQLADMCLRLIAALEDRTLVAQQLSEALHVLSMDRAAAQAALAAAQKERDDCYDGARHEIAGLRYELAAAQAERDDAHKANGETWTEAYAKAREEGIREGIEAAARATENYVRGWDIPKPFIAAVAVGDKIRAINSVQVAVCKWTEKADAPGWWDTGCGKEWWTEDDDMLPSECGINFCFVCGKRIDPASISPQAKEAGR